VKLVRYADRPDLRERRYEELSVVTFPKYMHHNAMGWRFWSRLYDEFPEFQVALVDGDELVAEAHALPIPWDGTAAGLPAGWDDGFELGMTSGARPGALMALAISVSPRRQGGRLSSRMIEAFKDNARTANLPSVLAPVRPTWKERYPLIAIERYIEWRREDGSHVDPWIRIHEQVGGEILAVAPESMTIRAQVAEWEEWTGMRFPEDGEYIFPGALATLVVRGGIGTHVEPNVWLLHRL
jgi:hypothetical protein